MKNDIDLRIEFPAGKQNTFPKMLNCHFKILHSGKFPSETPLCGCFSYKARTRANVWWRHFPSSECVLGWPSSHHHRSNRSQTAADGATVSPARRRTTVAWRYLKKAKDPSLQPVSGLSVLGSCKNMAVQHGGLYDGLILGQRKRNNSAIRNFSWI